MGTFQNFFQKPYFYLAVILTGIIITFTKLDQTYFWEDEVSTIMHTSGIPLSEFPDFFPQNEIKNISFYHEQLLLNNGNFTVSSQIRGLMNMPQFTPFHYVLLIFWHRIIGDGYMDYRWFSFFVYLLTLPLLFYLSIKIFKSRLAAWISVSLFSISPFFSFFSIEARYYMLWAFIIVALHAAFLKSLEERSKIWWILYGLTAVIAMYISLFSSLVIVSHALFVFIRKREKWLPFTVSQAVVFLAYLPWLLFMYNNHTMLTEAMAWQKASTWNIELSIWQLLFGQLTSMGKLFLSTTSRSWVRTIIVNRIPPPVILDMILVGIVTLIVLAGFAYSIKMADRENRWLLLLLIIPNFLFFLITDLIRGSGLAFIERYMIVNYIVVFLSLGFAIASLFKYKKVLSIVICFLLIFCCIVSLSLVYNNPCMAKRRDCPANLTLAGYLSSSGKTLLITDYTPSLMNFMSVLIATDNDSLDILYTHDIDSDFKNKYPLSDYRNVYAVHASNALSDHIKKNLAGTASINFEVMKAGWEWTPGKN